MDVLNVRPKVDPAGYRSDRKRLGIASGLPGLRHITARARVLRFYGFTVLRFYGFTVLRFYEFYGFYGFTSVYSHSFIRMNHCESMYESL